MSLPGDTEHAASSVPDESDDEGYRYGVLTPVLMTYFVPGRELDFLRLYEQYGETRAEFAGLDADLKRAIQEPKHAARELNPVLDTDLPETELRGLLASLLDQIRGTGEFSEEAEERLVLSTGDRPESEALLAYYWKRPVSLPAFMGPLGNREFPFYYTLLVGMALVALGMGIDQLPLPGFVNTFTAGLMVLGLIILGWSAVAMLGLRNELRRPDREIEKQEAREDYARKRRERAEKSRRFFL